MQFIGSQEHPLRYEDGARVLPQRPMHVVVGPEADLPADTRLWAALQEVSGGTWRGNVYDVERIISVLEAGKKALRRQVDD